MKPTARRQLIFVLFVLSLSPVGLLIPHYASIYSALKPYHVEGIGIGCLASYVLANFCAPGLMPGAGSKTEYENSGPREIATLYLSVMAITFAALVVTTVILWCLGWLLVFIELPFYWLKELIKDWIIGSPHGQPLV
jgi:hypothetical protein